jgi:hypothetical protein
MKTKKFYSIRLKEGRENIPLELAKSLLLDESNLIKWLHKCNALKFRYNQRTHMLTLRAENKHLTMGRMMYPEIFEGRGRAGFMELYISRLINKKIMLEKGSS